MSEFSLTVRLNTKSAMIIMGEPIDAFSDARLMGEAADEITRLNKENEKLKEVLKGAESWIDRWTKHAGSCKGDGQCTCGRVFILNELNEALKCG